MSIVRENLRLPEDFAVKPDAETYIRVGKVAEVSIFTRDLLVQYVDGERDPETTNFIEAAVLATVVVGSGDPETTFAPSASVYGRGDLVAVMNMGESGERYVVSSMDDYEVPNRAGAALVNGWALFDVLNGLVIDIVDDAENSYIEFWNYTTHLITRIVGTPTTDDDPVVEGQTPGMRVMRRMLDYFGTIGQPVASLCNTTNTGWQVETLGGGPQVNMQERLAGDFWDLGDGTFEQFDVTVDGGFCCGFKQIIDIPFGAADLSASLSAHHPVLTYLGKELCHPLASTTLEMYYNPTVFRFGEADADFVVIASVYPTWGTCQSIDFVEIPAYALAERKRIVVDPDPENPPPRDLEETTTHAWQLAAEDVRFLYSIPRDYVNWNVFADNFDWSEQVTRALPILTPRYNGTLHTFGAIDSRGYIFNNTPQPIDKLNKILGTIERVARAEDDPAANGSFWDYDIQHNDPASGTGLVDSEYTIIFTYFDDNAGDKREHHWLKDPTKEYPVILDGTHALTKKVDFDYDIIGEYVQDGDGYWGGEISSTHHWEENFYIDGVLIYQDWYTRTVETDPIELMQWDMVYRMILHIDMAMRLVVVQEVEFSYTGTAIWGDSTETYRCVVYWNGARHVIWEMEYHDTSASFLSYRNFPYVWHAGGLSEIGTPEQPATAPYDTYDEYVAKLWWPAYAISSRIEPNPFNFHPGTIGRDLSYPFMMGEAICQVQMGLVFNDYHETNGKPTGVPYLQVSTDMATGSWAIRAPCWLYEGYPSEMTTDYPGTHDTLCRHQDINDGVPYYGVLNSANGSLVDSREPMNAFYVPGIIKNTITLNKVDPEE